MKIVIESYGCSAADDFFKDVSRQVLHNLGVEKKSRLMEGKLVFRCLPLTKRVRESPDINLVTIRYTIPTVKEDFEIVQAIIDSVEKMERILALCPGLTP